jgi:hypothetical protein
VGGEHGAGAHHLQCLGEAEAAVDEVADALQPEEPGVTLVGVEHFGRVRTGQLDEQFDRAHAADTEQQLLQKAVLSPAAVQPVGDGAQLVRVLRDVGVE